MGHEAKGQRRPALVSCLSERGDQTRRYPPLDEIEPELELHVRGVPLDGPAQELRCQGGSLRYELGGDNRGLRGMSRPGLGSRCLGARSAELVAVWQASRSR